MKQCCLQGHCVPAAWLSDSNTGAFLPNVSMSTCSVSIRLCETFIILCLTQLTTTCSLPLQPMCPPVSHLWTCGGTCGWRTCEVTGASSFLTLSDSRGSMLIMLMWHYQVCTFSPCTPTHTHTYPDKGREINSHFVLFSFLNRGHAASYLHQLIR